MRKFPFRLVLAFVLTALIDVSCGKEQTQNSHEEASRLFNNIHKVTLLYTDSILSAGDSVALFGLFNRYEERLEEINYGVLPDTDYNLTEGENDTIKMAMDSLISAKLRRLKELGERKFLAGADSLVTDSVNSTVP